MAATKKSRKVLRCVLCDAMFGAAEVERLDYFPESMVCFNCYAAGQEQPYGVWCFGKKNKIDPNTKHVVAYGYHPGESEDCRYHCPDRKICYLFATGRITRLREILSAFPFHGEPIEAKVFVLCALGTTRKKLEDQILAYGGDVEKVITRLREGGKWRWVENGEKIRIEIPKQAAS